MSTNSVIRARINEQIKDEASLVLSSMGLTLSDAFRMLVTRIAHEKALPFAPLVPNLTTIKAIKAARAGKFTEVDNIENLLPSLNAKD